MTTLVPGMMVTPNVRLERPLGEGGMGSVWLADHLSLHSKVVVKFISDALATNEEARARFSREAAAASQVRSPHVVQTFDHGITADGVPYIVMEHLEGRSLGVALVEEGTLRPAMVIDIITQLSRALEKAHGVGVVHRDIKPDNIFLCDAGDGAVFVKLLDFGIAKGSQSAAISGETKTGSVMGSPLYMSPEQLMGAKTLDSRTDLWSVGVVVFECLSGARPFEADTIGALTMRVHNTQHPIPSQAIPGAPPALDDWFAKACAVKPEDRFASAKALAEALSAALTGAVWSNVSASSVPASPSMSRTLEAAQTTLSPVAAQSKKPLLFAALGLVTVLLLAYALWPKPMVVQGAPTIQALPPPSVVASTLPAATARPAPALTALPSVGTSAKLAIVPTSLPTTKRVGVKSSSVSPTVSAKPVVPDNEGLR
jgi:eukaryotic-like serine/threonine-protein kinase